MLWYYYQPLNLFTYTVPQQVQHDSFYASKFSMLLENVRRNHKVNSYIWVAETQKRGAIHYHMVTHKYLPVKWMNDYWCDLIGQYSGGAVDVRHVPKDIECLPLYLAKYLSKSPGRILECRSFGSSRDLKLPVIPFDVPPPNPRAVLTRRVEVDGVPRDITTRYYSTTEVLERYWQI